MDDLVLNVSCRCIPVHEGLIYVMSSCRSGLYEVWTCVRNYRVMEHQFSFHAGSIGNAVDLAIANYQNGNLFFWTLDDDNELIEYDGSVQ